jgi:hypothetical protein
MEVWNMVVREIDEEGTQGVPSVHRFVLPHTIHVDERIRILKTPGTLNFSGPREMNIMKDAIVRVWGG